MKELFVKILRVLEKYIFVILGLVLGLFVINTRLWVILYKLLIVISFMLVGYKVGENIKKVTKVIKAIFKNLEYTIEDIKDIYYEIDIEDYNTKYEKEKKDDKSSDYNKSIDNKKKDTVTKESNLKLDLEEEKKDLEVKVFEEIVLNKPKKQNKNNTNTNKKIKDNKEKEVLDKTDINNYSEEEIKTIEEAYEMFKEIKIEDDKENKNLPQKYIDKINGKNSNDNKNIKVNKTNKYKKSNKNNKKKA